MTGAGAPGAAGIIKCLLQDESVQLTVADADENALGKYLHPQFVKIPKAEDSTFVEELLSLCQNKHIAVILPLVTRELFPLSQHRQQFAEVGTKVLVSAHPAIQIANNKAACYRFLQQANIPVPAFRLVTTTEEFMHAAVELGYPQKPFCFKPCVANGSRGFRIVTNDINEADLLFLSKPYNPYITYPHALTILSSQPFPPLVLTEYLPGEEYSVDCLANHGKTVIAVPRLRRKMINGISVQGKFVQDEAIIHYCAAMIEAVGLHGNIGIQAKRSKEGSPLLLEINPRVQGTIVSALGAGVNLPLLAVRQELGLEVKKEELQVNWKTAFSRYWTEVFYESC